MLRGKPVMAQMSATDSARRVVLKVMHPRAAALYGGFTVAVTEDDERITLRRFRVPEAWIPVAFIPQRESRTHEMRDVLPATVPHAAAARQAGRSALLATAIMTSDAGLLRAAMSDELHQPYRLPLLAGSRELIDLAYERGAAGTHLRSCVGSRPSATSTPPRRS